MKQMKTLTIGSNTYEVVDEAARGRTYADVGAAPAVESIAHPGCYYRTMGGVTEWVNPPMALGVEYRTTERYNDKPVYAMRVNVGALPNATTKSVTVVAGGNVIRCSACAFVGGDSISIPFTVGSSYIIGCHGQNGNVVLYSNYDCAGFTGYVTAWYIKD